MLLSRVMDQWYLAQQNNPSIVAVVRLLKGWAQRRGFMDQPDALSGLFLAMLATHLVHEGVLVCTSRIHTLAILSCLGI